MGKKILFIGTLPPPVDGMTKATLGTYEAMLDHGAEVKTINMSRNYLSRGVFGQVARMRDLLLIYFRLIKTADNFNSIYFTISESRLGNIKDMLIYLLIYRNLNILTIHMLGGAGMDKILHSSKWLSILNTFFMKKMNGVIVEGNRGYSVFGNLFSRENIHVLPNFVDDYLFTSKDLCLEKYENVEKIRVLYLSNMIPEKGFIALLDAIDLLPAHILSQFEFTFVGGFQYLDLKVNFEERIKKLSMIKYLGDFIDGEDKKLLYGSTHIFCLPTFYPYEGQPISILEAYASGCAVMTTPHAGIPDIFKDNINGFEVEPNSPESIASCLCKIVSGRNRLIDFATHNIVQATKFNHRDNYKSKVAEIFHLD